MAWIESHQALKEHPKVSDLRIRMNWDLDTTLGKLHRFWWWCVDYAEDGDLRKHNDGRIADAMGVAIDDAKGLVDAMVQARWLDREPYFRVHDWWEYAGRFLQVRWKRKPTEWQKVRAMYASPLLERLQEPLQEPQTNIHTDTTNQPTAETGLDSSKDRFPVTVDDAIKQCELVAVTKDFVMHCFDKGASRGGLDSQGIEIRNFASYVRKEWKYEQDRIGQRKFGSGASGQGVSRNAGTSNDGNAQHYDLSKIQKNRGV